MPGSRSLLIAEAIMLTTRLMIAHLKHGAVCTIAIAIAIASCHGCINIIATSHHCGMGPIVTSTISAMSTPDILEWNWSIPDNIIGAE